MILSQFYVYNIFNYIKSILDIRDVGLQPGYKNNIRDGKKFIISPNI